MSRRAPPVLVIGWGNPSRGDDALGPLLVERLVQHVRRAGLSGRVEVLTDFQLQVEHALDLVGREHVLFVDAANGLRQPFAARPVRPARGFGIGTHALAPEALLQIYANLQQSPPPPATLLAIRASRFELGEAPGAQALADLELAWQWTREWLADRVSFEEWNP